MGKSKLQILREITQANRAAIKARISIESAHIARNYNLAYRYNPPTPPYPALPEAILRDIIEMLQAGISPKEISSHTDVKLSVIMEVVAALPRTQEYYEEKRNIVERLLKTTDLSYAAISRKTKLPTGTIRRWVRKYGWPERKGSYDAAFIEQVKDYCIENPNASYTEIANLFGVADVTVKRWCEGLVSKKRSPLATLAQKEEALELCFTTKLPYAEIGQKVGVNAETVRQWAKASGVARRSLKTYSAEIKEGVRELCLKYAFNYKLIATLTGIKIGNIRNWCRKLKNQHAQEQNLPSPGRKLQKKRRKRGLND